MEHTMLTNVPQKCYLKVGNGGSNMITTAENMSTAARALRQVDRYVGERTRAQRRREAKEFAASLSLFDGLNANQRDEVVDSIIRLANESSNYD